MSFFRWFELPELLFTSFCVKTENLRALRDTQHAKCEVRRLQEYQLKYVVDVCTHLNFFDLKFMKLSYHQLYTSGLF